MSTFDFVHWGGLDRLSNVEQEVATLATGGSIPVGSEQFPPLNGRHFNGDPLSTSAANGGAALNDLVLGFPLYSGPIPITLGEIGIGVQAATASAVARLGVWKVRNQSLPYDWAPGTPYADLLLDAGTVDCSTTGAKTIAASLVIPARTFFCLSSCPQVALATLYVGVGTFAGFGLQAVAGLSASGFPGIKASVTGALPASFTPTGGSNRGCGATVKRSA